MSVGCLCVNVCVWFVVCEMCTVGFFCWLCVLRVVLYVVQLLSVCDGDLCLAVFERMCVCLVELRV